MGNSDAGNRSDTQVIGNGAYAAAADAAGASAAGGFRARQAVVILLALAVIVGGAALLLQLFVAQRLPELTEARFDAAEALWEESGPDTYSMDIEIRGAQPGNVSIEVRDGTPTAMKRDGLVPPERTWSTWTVPGMFHMLTEEFAIQADPTHKGQGAPGAKVWLRCHFDPRYGYPAIYQRLMTGGGPEVYWRVTRFEPN